MLSQAKIYSLLREMSKGNYWQTVYVQSKEMGGMQVFENLREFTPLQIYFLNQLSFYNSLYLDIAMGDVDEFVLEDEIYEDAYSYYKSKERKKKAKERKVPIQKPQQKSGDKKDTLSTTDTWLLKKK